MKFNLKVYCEKTRLKDIRDFVEEKLKPHTNDELIINQLVLAVDEICANLIIHSNSCNPDEEINLQVRVDANGVTFKITDKGKQFNFKEYKEPSIQEVVETRKKGGIGLLLVKKIMDRVEFSSKEKSNTCILYKQFSK